MQGSASAHEEWLALRLLALRLLALRLLALRLLACSARLDAGSLPRPGLFGRPG